MISSPIGCPIAPQDAESLERAAQVEQNRWRGRELYRPSYNVGPGRFQPILVQGEGGHRELASMVCALRLLVFA